jgi:hypothetical protein
MLPYLHYPIIYKLIRPISVSVRGRGICGSLDGALTAAVVLALLFEYYS